MPSFTIQPPTPAHATLTYPAPHILLVTLNRPRDLNCINAQGHADLHAVWEWLDEEPSMRVGILTGKGRAFCAGADLKGELASTADPINISSITKARIHQSPIRNPQSTIPKPNPTLQSIH